VAEAETMSQAGNPAQTLSADGVTYAVGPSATLIIVESGDRPDGNAVNDADCLVVREPFPRGAADRRTLSTLHMRQSMGRTGSCYDNAAAESFFASLKAEIGTKIWATRAEARRAVFAYLTYYNHNRLHSTLKRLTPYEARLRYRQPNALAA
jgi:hypothetical protein